MRYYFNKTEKSTGKTQGKHRENTGKTQPLDIQIPETVFAINYDYQSSEVFDALSEKGFLPMLGSLFQVIRGSISFIRNSNV